MKTLSAARTLCLALFGSCALFAVPIWDTRAQDPAKPTTECDKLFKKLKDSYASLPKQYRGMSNAAAKNLGNKVQASLKDCRSYLSLCGSADKAKAGEVEFYFAKNLYLLSAQYRATLIEELRKQASASGGKFPSDTLQKQMGSYYGTMARAAAKGFNALAEDHKLRPQALKLLGQAHSGAKSHAQARDAFKRFLKLYPTHDDSPPVTTALARAHLRLEEYDAGIAVANAGRKNRKIYNSPTYPYLGEALWKLYEGKGDFTGMLTTARAALRLYKLRVADPKLEKFLKEDYRRYIIFNGFRVGYVEMASGKFDEARVTFRDYIDGLDARARELQASGGELPPYARIYQKRAADSLKFIEQLVDQAPPADFDLGSHWVTAKRVSLKKDLGKIIVIVFRGIEDTRSGPFLEGINSFCAEAKDVEIATVSFLRSGGNFQEQADQLREELDAVGFTGAAGFDPDDQKKTLFRAFGANVGSATLMVFRQDGTAAWFQQDPRDVDVNFVITILKRLQAEG